MELNTRMLVDRLDGNATDFTTDFNDNNAWQTHVFIAIIGLILAPKAILSLIFHSLQFHENKGTWRNGLAMLGNALLLGGLTTGVVLANAETLGLPMSNGTKEAIVPSFNIGSLGNMFALLVSPGTFNYSSPVKKAMTVLNVSDAALLVLLTLHMAAENYIDSYKEEKLVQAVVSFSLTTLLFLANLSTAVVNSCLSKKPSCCRARLRAESGQGEGLSELDEALLEGAAIRPYP